MNILEYLNVRGHVTVHKFFDNGNEELVYDDHNIIVSGMGLGLASFFGLSGSTSILDYQIDRFQIGLSGNIVNEVSSTNKLTGPLATSYEYTGDFGEIPTVSSNQFAGSFIPTPVWYGRIPAHNVTRINDRSVRYTITIDKFSCNNITRGGLPASINEIGLFMKNPLYILPNEASVLVAYKVFSNVIKTEDFGLIFRWTITF